jgi:hypothetical protein
MSWRVRLPEPPAGGPERRDGSRPAIGDVPDYGRQSEGSAVGPNRDNVGPVTISAATVYVNSAWDVVTAIATVGAAVGTVGAVVVALYISVWRERRRSPKLSLALEDLQSEMEYALSWERPEAMGDPGIPLPEVMYVEVTNADGRVTAHDVEVLLSVDYTNRQGETYTHFEHRPLVWAYATTQTGLPLTSVSIPPGVTRKAELLRYGPWTWIDAYVRRMSALANAREDADALELNAVFTAAPITSDHYLEIAEWMSYELRLVVSARDVATVAYRTELQSTVERDENAPHPTVSVAVKLGPLTPS